MKKIGHSTLFLPTGKNNPRNGESTFVRLSDEKILLAFTQYISEDWEDHAAARICGCFSSDEGETWTAPTVLIEKEPSAQNIMSPSLFRMKNGQLGLVYLRKDVNAEGYVTCMPVFSASEDDGAAWSRPVYCTAESGYYCVINDGCTVDRSGRIWVPMSYHGICYDAFGHTGIRPGKYKNSVIRFACSDDNGRTWNTLPAVIESPFADTIGFAEPGIYEHEDGRLWTYCRSAYGLQYQSFSEDRGITWTPAVPNFHFTSPDAPMRVKRTGDITVAVFNPKAFSCVQTATEVWNSPKRTPLVCAVSFDDGRSFDTAGKTLANGQLLDFAANCFLLEDDETNSYCYPAVIGVKDGFLVSYYHSNGTPICLNSSRVVKVFFNEIHT